MACAGNFSAGPSLLWRQAAYHPLHCLQSFLAGVPRLALGARDDQVGWQHPAGSQSGKPSSQVYCRTCMQPPCAASCRAALSSAPQGNLLRVDVVATADLPRISAQHQAAWSGNQALAFGAAALAWMRAQAAAQPGAHLRFSYGGGGDGGAIQCGVVEGGALPARIQACLNACGLAL